MKLIMSKEKGLLNKIKTINMLNLRSGDVIKKGGIVVVLNLDSYTSEYAEAVPFGAMVTRITSHPTWWVKSIKTGKEYELYDWQLLEFLKDEDLAKIIDLQKYEELENNRNLSC